MRYVRCFPLTFQKIVVGCPLQKADTSSSGRVYVYDRDGDSWSKAAVITSNSGAFGSSVSVLDFVVVGGAPEASDAEGKAVVISLAGRTLLS